MKDTLHSACEPAEVRADEFPAGELFAAASTAVLVAQGATGRIVAINAAAQFLLGLMSADLLGHHWHEVFHSPGAPELKAAARQASILGRVARVAVARSGAGVLRATLSAFYVSRHAYLLVHLDAVHEPRRSVLNNSDDLFDRLDNLPMGLVITDGALCVEFANREFLDLTGVPSRDAAEGKSLLRWLDLTQDHLDQLHRQMQLRQAATVMTTSSSTWYGPGPSFEVIAVAVPDTASQNWGFVLRQLSRQPLPGCGFRSHDDSGAGRF